MLKEKYGVTINREAADLYFIYQNSLFDGDNEFASAMLCELKYMGFQCEGIRSDHHSQVPKNIWRNSNKTKAFNL